jgi:tripartite-type tricarboxylate transporter receptor subunit TctC
VKPAVFLLGACATLLAVPPPAGAAQYPEKSIRMILPGPPGGGADLLARMLSAKLSTALGVGVVIDNRSGAGGLVGTELAAKASPDGYTVIVGNSGPNAVLPAMLKSIPYDPLNSFAPVSLVASTVNLLVVHPAVTAGSVAELIALAKAKPGMSTFASGGSGQSSHLSGELFRYQAGVEIVHVPYKGSGPAVLDLIGGRVSMMFGNIPSVMPQVAVGKLRALAVTSARRSRLVAQLPTMSEAGLPGYESIQWYGVLAPAATPGIIVRRLHAEIVAAVNAPDLQEQMLKQGFDTIGGTPAEFAAYLRAEIDKWKKVVAAAGIKPD